LYHIFWSQKNVSNTFPFQQIHSSFKPSCQIDRGHIKVPQHTFDTLNTLVTRQYKFWKAFFLSVLHDHTLVNSLTQRLIQTYVIVHHITLLEHIDFKLTKLRNIIICLITDIRSEQPTLPQFNMYSRLALTPFL